MRRVAVAGMGGVGGVHLITLARLGVGRFNIADPDTFEVANFNRQYGALQRNVGRGKAETDGRGGPANQPRTRSPRPRRTDHAGKRWPVSRRSFAGTGRNRLLFIRYSALLFREARQRGLWAITAGPIGFSAAWVLFDPQGMEFDAYFDLHDGMAPIDQFAAFATALAPAGLHLAYFDKKQIQGKSARGPSCGAACQICSGVAAVEAAKVILGRKPLRPAPYYAQFDAYRCRLRHGRLIWGNRGPLQRLKRAILRRTMLQLGYGK